MLSRPDPGTATFIGPKFVKAAWSGVVSGEQFHLPNTGAHDIVPYDVVKQIARLERFVDGRPGSNGLLLCVTKRLPPMAGTGRHAHTIAEAFRIHHGSRVHDTRQWDARAGVGTSRGRTAPLPLRGDYNLEWLPNSLKG
jgi:hypothetical protein